MRTRAVPYTIALLVFLLDRLTKSLIERSMSLLDTVTVIPGFFNIIHTKNRGAAFSMFASSESAWRTFLLIGLSGVALVLIAWLLWRSVESPWLRYGLALILGGALGNVYDRVVYGAVIDFVELYVGEYHWPAFNVADSAITVGAALAIVDMWRSHRTAENT